jgi:hypothetical protein
MIVSVGGSLGCKAKVTPAFSAWGNILSKKYYILSHNSSSEYSLSNLICCWAKMFVLHALASAPPRTKLVLVLLTPHGLLYYIYYYNIFILIILIFIIFIFIILIFIILIFIILYLLLYWCWYWCFYSQVKIVTYIPLYFKTSKKRINSSIIWSL